MKRTFYMEKLAVSALMAAMLSASVMAAPYVILTNGQRKEGVDIRKMSNGDVLLTMSDGNQFTYTPGQVRKAVADKPQYFDKAAAALRAGNADAAVAGLEKIVSDYRGLEWDVRAMPYLAQAYSAKGDYLKAERAFDKLFEQSPGLKKNSDLNVAYAEVLLKAKKMSSLESHLSDMISSGDRKAAAFAQLMRGNIELQRQDYKAAAKDYLRTVYFFRNQTEVMPEATFKLAEALDKMRDKRAREWYQTVVDSYPGTEFASKARANL